jgi:hypothetical protein
MAAAQSAKAQLCPNPPWDGSSYVTEVVYNDCTYRCTYCCGIIEGYHCVALMRIDVKNGCKPENFENNAREITDAILIKIAQSGLPKEWGLGQIPECPESICVLRLYDAICYHGWIYNDVTEFYEMDRCDNEIRSCNEVVRICWVIENGVQVIKVQREGTLQGPSCDENNGLGCHTNCGE